MIAGCSQILATALMVQLFKQKNYAVGVGLAKSEAILAAIIGVTFFSGSFVIPGLGLVWRWADMRYFLLSKGQQVSGFSAENIGDRHWQWFKFCHYLASGTRSQSGIKHFTHLASCGLGAVNGDQFSAPEYAALP